MIWQASCCYRKASSVLLSCNRLLLQKRVLHDQGKKLLSSALVSSSIRTKTTTTMSHNDLQDPEPKEPLFCTFRGNKQVPVTYVSSVSHQQAVMAIKSEPFQNWINNIIHSSSSSSTEGRDDDDDSNNNHSSQKKKPKLQDKTQTLIDLHHVELQSVDMFGPKRVGFIKLNSHCTLLTTKEDGSTVISEDSTRLPGICFLRGSSVGILVKLHCIDNNKDYSLLVGQPRIPVGEATCLELPAGMIDEGSDSIKGVAIKEMKEECGLDIQPKDLVDLTSNSNPKGICPSPGGCDEYLKLMYYERLNVTKKELDEMRNKLTGLKEEGEIITLKVVEFDNIWKICHDAKALCALYLLQKLQETRQLGK